MSKVSILPLPDDFEAGLSELETIIATLESGELSLEVQMDYYTRGNALLKFCETRLNEVEQKINVLNVKDELINFTLDENT